MQTLNIRAIECINRHLHVHTHVWRYEDSPRVRDFQESAEWIADVDRVYAFEDIPILAKEFAAGNLETYFAVFQVNPV